MLVKDVIREDKDGSLRVLLHCEFCKTEKKGWGFNEREYFEISIPQEVCKKCGKNSIGTNKE